MTASAAAGHLPPDRFDAVLFDLDGVLTSTATLHTACWKRVFDEFLSRWAEGTGTVQAPFDPVDDYLRFVDGKPRAAGVRDFLASRGIVLAEREQGNVDAFPGSVAWVKELRGDGLRTAVVSSSENAPAVLEAAGIADLFDTV